MRQPHGKIGDCEESHMFSSCKICAYVFRQASRTALHKASIGGQYDTVRMLLYRGEDVDERDEVSFPFYLRETGLKMLLLSFLLYCYWVVLV